MQTNDPKGKGRATEATQSAQGSPTSGRPVPASPPLGSKDNPIRFDYKPNDSQYSYDPNDPRPQNYGRHSDNPPHYTPLKPGAPFQNFYKSDDERDSQSDSD